MASYGEHMSTTTKRRQAGRRRKPMMTIVMMAIAGVVSSLIAGTSMASADAPLVLYADDLGPGVADWSWTAVDLASTTEVHNGTASIAVDFSPWGGLFLALPDPITLDSGNDVPGTEVTLWVRGGDGVPATMKAATLASGNVVSYEALFDTTPGQWVPVTLPVTGSTFAGLWLMNNSPNELATVYVDDVVLSGLAPEPSPEPEPTPPPPNGFVEDFSSNDSLDRFEVGIFHRDDFVVTSTSWFGDHAPTGPNDSCGPPEQVRLIERSDPSGWIYRCRPGGDVAAAHLMTAIGDTSGYSIGSFTPYETFEGIREVRWDVNMTDLGYRQFTEVKVIPEATFDTQQLPCAIDFPCDTPSHGALGSVGTSTFNGELHIHNGSQLSSQQYDTPADPALNEIRTRRTHFFRDNGDGTLTFGVERPDGSFQTHTANGSFPAGPVRVVFADHNYTPEKSVDEGQVNRTICREAGKFEPSSSLSPPCLRYTWHWDDIEIT